MFPGKRGTEGLGRQGAVLMVASLAILFILYGTTVGVIAAGAERWRTLPNPDPAGGAIGALFFLTSTLLLIASVASTFIVFSHAGEYRNAWTDHIRRDAGQRWTGSLFILAGIPFLVLSFFAVGALLQLLWFATFLAFGTGGAYHLHSHLRADTARP